MPVPIIKQASDAIVQALADRKTGFNVQLQAFFSEYGLNMDPWSIDWADDSANFFKSEFGILDLWTTNSAEVPACCLYEGGDAWNGLVVSATFAGPMSFVIEH